MRQLHQAEPMIAMPRCRNCGRFWRPALGVVAPRSYCLKCSNERHASAKETFDLRCPETKDFEGPYMMVMRRSRSS
jgi:hypothetical protein